MKISEINYNKLSSGLKQYYDIKIKHLDKIVFFQLGDFFEMFFEDAQFMNQYCGLVLTKKSAGLEEKIPMAGIPLNSKNEYIKKIIELNKKVVIVEQTNNIKNKIVERKITKIFSKSNFIDDEQLDNNYVGFIEKKENNLILTYGDLITGDIFEEIYNDENLLLNQIMILNFTEIFTINFDFNNFKKIIIENNNENIGYNALIDYFKFLSCDKIEHLKELKKNDLTKKMFLNHVCKKQLELIDNINGGKENTLFSFLNKTKTAMGKRKLKKDILEPFYNLKIIEEKLDILETYVNKNFLLDEINSNLSGIYDLEKLIVKIADESILPKDLNKLKFSLEKIPTLYNIIKNEKINYNINDELIENVLEVYNLIEQYILEDPTNNLKEGGYIKPNSSAELKDIINLKENVNEWLINFELQEQEKTNIKKLKVKYNRVFGYFIEIPNAFLSYIPENYIRKQTTTSGERFITEELKEMEFKILNSKEEQIEIEKEILQKIQKKLKIYIKELQKISEFIQNIDVHYSLAKTAIEENLVRPKFNNDKIIDIKEGFHPMIKKTTNLYINNDCLLKDKNILLITGPNMAGKSTYMRQIAITIIMAQIGSFVPCEYANLSLIDKIFTRIGTSDDSSQGLSTFMVEMTESATALEEATENSLLIFDELGRGTSTYDGIALSAAILEFINEKIKSFTLFSTHFHELILLENKLNKVKNVHVKAKEENDTIKFFHKVIDGGVDKSYGISVAKLAKLPIEVIVNAKSYLKFFSNEEKDNKKIDVKEENKIIEYLNEIDVNSLTPIQALNELSKLKELVNDEN